MQRREFELDKERKLKYRRSKMTAVVQCAVSVSEAK